MTAAGRFRAHARRKVSLAGVLASAKEGSGSEVDVEDLALGGACVSLLDAPGVGERVTLAIVSPDLWDPVQMPGRIAWTGSAPDEETQRAGVSFEPTDPRATMALFELIGSLG